MTCSWNKQIYDKEKRAMSCSMTMLHYNKLCQVRHALSLHNWLLLTLLFLILPLASAAQGIGGKVLDAKGVPIEGATVMENTTLHGCVTDAEGRFVMRYDGDFPVNLIVRCLGFRTDTLSLERRSRNITIVLNMDAQAAEQVDVVAKRRDVGFESIDARVAQQMTSADGGIEAVIKSQMGVSSNSELSSQYRVRGGNFDENLVYVNGVEIYRPFLIRSGEQEGLSFVNPDMVSELNFSAGGFDASYGDKMSSVLDVRYKVPTETHFGAQVSLLGASAHLEGAWMGGKLTHVTGVRYKTNQYLFGSLDTQGDYAPTFFDAQTYWTFRPSAQTTIGLLAYYADNSYSFDPKNRETTFGTISDARKLTIYFEGRERDKYRTCVVAADAKHALSESLSLSFAASMFRTQEQESYDILGEYWMQQAAASQTEQSVDQSMDIGVGGYMQHARNHLFGEVYSLSAGVTWQTQSTEFRAQAKMTREHYADLVDEWEYTDSAGYISSPTLGNIVMSDSRYADNSLWMSRPEVYVVGSTVPLPIGPGSLSVTTGFRVAHQSASSSTIYSPRLGLRYALGQWRMRLATGRYSQLPNLREMRKDDGSLNLGLKPQKSWQLLAGADLFFGSEEMPCKFTVEAYYKWLRNLNPYSIDNVRIRYEAENCARGYAAGVDLKLNAELVQGAESWVTLSLMQTKEDIESDGHGSIPRPSDQRVQFSAVLQDYMPGNKSVTAMLSMFFGSGLPFGPQGSERWQQTSRMPGYKRVDLGLAKDFAIDSEGNRKRNRLRTAKLGVEVFNLLDTENTISYFWVRDTNGFRYGVPNYLTSRRFNVKLTLEF